jgi:hypothetical protein
MSKEGNMEKLKGCYWKDDGIDSSPCLDNSGCQYSSIDSVKAKMYREGCKYFKD